MSGRGAGEARLQREVAGIVALGAAWLERGHEDRAAAHLERALALDPSAPDAHRWTGYLRVRQGAFAAAAEHLAVAAASSTGHLAYELAVVRELAGRREPLGLPDHPGGRLRFRTRFEGRQHRSGWRDAMAALEPLHHRDGVLFEPFVEDPFAWQHPRPGVRPPHELLAALRSPDFDQRITSEERGIVPFREPWVGVVHNPHEMPSWFHGADAPQVVVAKDVWRASVEQCVGLFALSEHAAEWWRAATGRPVSTLLLPTETPAVRFDLDRFLANPRKHVVQVGWWLRRQASIDRLPLPPGNALGYTKLRLVADFGPGAAEHVRSLRAVEEAIEGRPDPASGPVVERHHLPDDDYDELLAENVCFLDLYDASANNAVVECIVRGTPLLVNPLPAVREYLGDDYPLYYADLQDAAAKALDVGRLRAAHEHLLASPVRPRLDPVAFRREFEASEVYGLL